jgi:hypothetical protein
LLGIIEISNAKLTTLWAFKRLVGRCCSLDETRVVEPRVLILKILCELLYEGLRRIVPLQDIGNDFKVFACHGSYSYFNHTMFGEVVDGLLFAIASGSHRRRPILAYCRNVKDEPIFIPPNSDVVGRDGKPLESTGKPASDRSPVQLNDRYSPF